MQLGELVKDWPCLVKGSVRTEINHVEDDTRMITHGNLFVARKGKNFNGLTYIKEALAKGAVAIALDDEIEFDTLVVDVPLIWVPNCERFLAFASAKCYGFPSEAVQVIAVTGTNGKTTVTHFIGQLLNQLQQDAMVIGTNGIFLNGEKVDTKVEALTSLQAKDVQFLLSQAVQQSIPYVVLEASSIGLVRHRLDYCELALGVFLNVTEDHIEEHGSFENYKQAKQILAQLANKLIFNSDDAICRSISMKTKKTKYFFGKSNHVDFHIQLLNETEHDSVCCIQTDNEKELVTLPVVGEYQCSNVLAAISSVAALGYPLPEICHAAKSLKLPVGRFEKIPNELNIDVYIDYAHTPDAMKMILQTVKKHTKNKLIVVFSCGGERDRAKRPKMGMMASTYSDVIILTTDNARSELPQQINEQIQQGFIQSQVYECIIDRQQAIERAIKMAGAGDAVVILGKGHERTQHIGEKITPFSDKEWATKIIKQL